MRVFRHARILLRANLTDRVHSPENGSETSASGRGGWLTGGPARQGCCAPGRATWREGLVVSAMDTVAAQGIFWWADFVQETVMWAERGRIGPSGVFILFLFLVFFSYLFSISLILDLNPNLVLNLNTQI
jgi:hypothetical protein